MKLWLDDIRPPAKFGCLDFEWAKTGEEAIRLLQTGRVTYASLDHDLTLRATLGYWDGEFTGYEVLCWMALNECWPVDGVDVHSMSTKGKARMESIIRSHYGRTFPSVRVEGIAC
jgi:hypothetical protein